MLVYIYATEGIYQGLHGINACGVYEVSSMEDANEIGREMAEDLISSFGLEEEYEDSDIEEDLYWAIHKIKEGTDKGAHDLDVLCSRMEYSSFVREYCEEEAY